MTVIKKKESAMKRMIIGVVLFIIVILIFELGISDVAPFNFQFEIQGLNLLLSILFLSILFLCYLFASYWLFRSGWLADKNINK